MTTVQHIIDLVELNFPFECLAQKDNTGLIIGDPSWSVSRILAAVDLTEAVIEEAIAKDCQMILTHHHIMGKGVKKINPSSFEGRATIKCIENKIAFVACHNPLDFLTNGTADMLMQAVGCPVSAPMYEGYVHLATTPTEINAKEIPVPASLTKEGIVAGFGRVADLEEPCTLADILARLEGVVSGPVNVIGEDDKIIRRVVCQVGAGKTPDMRRAAKIGADVFITGDVCHDDRLLAAELGLAVLDFCHHEAELPGVLQMASLLRDNIAADGCGVEIIASRAKAPVRHLTMNADVDYARFGF